MNVEILRVETAVGHNTGAIPHLITCRAIHTCTISNWCNNFTHFERPSFAKSLAHVCVQSDNTSHVLYIASHFLWWRFRIVVYIIIWDAVSVDAPPHLPRSDRAQGHCPLS